MNLYSVIDIKTGKVIAESGTAAEIAKVLGGKPRQITQAACSNYLMQNRYDIKAVDTVIAKNSTIWIEWDIERAKLLRTARRKK